MSEPKIRPMAAADVDAVMVIAESLATAPHWPRSAYETAIDPAAIPQRIALVAEVSGAVSGFTVASLIPPQAELETIAISQPFQRCGAGSALLSALLRQLESCGISEITLEVRASNVAAQALYSAHSFVRSSLRKKYYADTGEDAVMMRAPLPLATK